MNLKTSIQSADYSGQDDLPIKACIIMHNEANLITVNTRLRTLLLIALTFALAIAPLRGALAIAALATTDTDSNCAEMMHIKSLSDSNTIQHQHATQSNKTDDCCQDCGGDCGDSSCVNCVNITTAILYTVSLFPDSHSTTQTVPVTASFPHGNFSPPFRPPVSL